SIVETAKENGLNPTAYLTYLFERMPNMDLKDEAAFEALLPWSEGLPDGIRVRK
ncbi:transposase domain-containing protein, partial [Alicyclobacillus sendaiensis]|uniref:transposase domain-containing protein n=1 Tax=Alicyclobacillus sendaiensis TaxID=192387 RepID=UPI00272D2B93